MNMASPLNGQDIRTFYMTRNHTKALPQNSKNDSTFYWLNLPPQNIQNRRNAFKTNEIYHERVVKLLGRPLIQIPEVFPREDKKIVVHKKCDPNVMMEKNRRNDKIGYHKGATYNDLNNRIYLRLSDIG